LDKDEEKWDLGQMSTLILQAKVGLINKFFDETTIETTKIHLNLIRRDRNHISHNISNIKVLSASNALELSESMLYVLKAS